MSGEEAKEQIDLKLEIKRLERKIRELEALQFKPCGTCVRCAPLDCMTIYYCPLLGYVDPERSGCTKHKERRYVQNQTDNQ